MNFFLEKSETLKNWKSKQNQFLTFLKLIIQEPDWHKANILCTMAVSDLDCKFTDKKSQAVMCTMFTCSVHVCANPAKGAAGGSAKS